MVCVLFCEKIECHCTNTTPERSNPIESNPQSNQLPLINASTYTSTDLADFGGGLAWKNDRKLVAECVYRQA